MRQTPDDVTFERDRHGHYKTRIRAGRSPRTGKGQQLRVTIATTDERVFRERLARLRELSAALIPQGLTAEAAVAIKKAAAQETDARFEVCCAAALELAPKVLAKPHRWNTFREIGEAWTRGDLHRRFPDHVKSKRTSDRDKGRLEYLYEVVVDAESERKLGDMPLALITFEHANAAMVQLPADCKRPAARRQYAQLIARVMKLAVFPAACIAASPLPVGFLPHVPEGDLLFQHLYPDEDLRLMRSAIAVDDGMVDYGERALFGLSNREGGRLGEFLRKLKWAGIDTRRGTLMLPGGVHRKGGKPSKWQAEPGSIEALEPLRALGLEGPFYHLPDDGKWAERLQLRMRRAGLEREALYYSNVDEGVRKMRGHDTRATYLTLGIASGLSETHLMARTGHTTSKMVHRYDHAAEALAASESGCKLMPLDYALGLYAVRRPPSPRRAGWMTLDPHSPEAEALERLALAPAAEGRQLGEGAAPVLLLGPGEGGETLLERFDNGDELLLGAVDTPEGGDADADAWVCLGCGGRVERLGHDLCAGCANAEGGQGEAGQAEGGEARPLPSEPPANDGGARGSGGAPRAAGRETLAAPGGRVVRGREVIDGELVDLAVGAGGGASAAPHPRPLARIGLGVRPHATPRGETEGETFSQTPGVCAEACGDESSMFSAVVAPAGVEPARLAARDFKCLRSRRDGAEDDLSARNPVAGGDGTAHGVSPGDPRVRRSGGPPNGPAEASPEGPAAPEGERWVTRSSPGEHLPLTEPLPAEGPPAPPSPAPPDPVLAGLRSAAHAAVDRGDAATVAAIMAAIEAHRAALARAAAPDPKGSREGVA